MHKIEKILLLSFGGGGISQGEDNMHKIEKILLVSLGGAGISQGESRDMSRNVMSHLA